MEEYYKSSDQLTSKLTRLLANLLAKLTKKEPLMGGHGGGGSPSSSRAGVRGIHSGEARTLGEHRFTDTPAGGLLARLRAKDYEPRTMSRGLLVMLVILVRLLVILARLSVRLLAIAAGTISAFYRIFGLSREIILSQ